MPGGWGKRAVGRADRKLEDDELFKEIGGQLEDANFDYSQWQRTKGKRQSVAGGILKKDHAQVVERYERPATGRLYTILFLNFTKGLMHLNICNW